MAACNDRGSEKCPTPWGGIPNPLLAGAALLHRYTPYMRELRQGWLKPYAARNRQGARQPSPHQWDVRQQTILRLPNLSGREKLVASVTNSGNLGIAVLSSLVGGYTARNPRQARPRRGFFFGDVGTARERIARVLHVFARTFALRTVVKRQIAEWLPIGTRCGIRPPPVSGYVPP